MVNNRTIYVGLILVGLVLVGVGFKNDIFWIAAIGGLMVGGFSVSLRFMSRYPQHGRSRLDEPNR